METDLDWERLGRAVRAARGVRSQKDIRENDGPSDETISKIEQGRYRPTRGVQKTLDKLEKGLGWAPGSVNAILAGGDPQPLASRDALDDESARLRIELSSIRHRQSGDDGMDTAAVRDIQDRLDTVNLERARAYRAQYEPLVDLVVDGQELAVQKADGDVSAYVRKVESAVVGVMGFTQLTAAVTARAESTKGENDVVETATESNAQSQASEDEEAGLNEAKARSASVTDMMGADREKSGKAHPG